MGNKGDRKPPPFGPYVVKFCLIPAAIVALLLSAGYPFIPAYERDYYAWVHVILPASTVVLSLLFYGAVLCPRKKPPAPWWKVLSMDSAEVLIDQSLDRQRKGKSFLNRPLIRFGPKTTRILLVLFWIGWAWGVLGTTFVAVMRGGLTNWCMSVPGWLISLFVLTYLTVKYRDRRALDYRPERDNARPPAQSADIDWYSSLLSDKAKQVRQQGET